MAPSVNSPYGRNTFLGLMGLGMILFPVIWMSVGSSSFCEKSEAMDMHMEGFKTVFSTETSCIVLFFSAWTLDNKVEFSCALWGIAFLAFCVEMLTCARREGISACFGRCGLKLGPCFPPSEVLVAITYTIHVLAGYILMLVAMTYQVELVAYLLCGLLMGHLMFNSRAAIGTASPDPCCVGRDDGSSFEFASGSTADERKPLV